MLDAIITSKTRLKILLKFFINPSTKGYLRELSAQMNESTNAVRVELDRLVEACYLERNANGNKVYYNANTMHPLYKDIHSVVKKYLGIDVLIDSVLAKLGKVHEAYIVGDYSRGIDSGIIDVVIIGTVDYTYLAQLISKAETIIKRKIRPLVLSPSEKKKYDQLLHFAQALLVWHNGR
ncbi:MAG TPA: ArsR family transcriptional regulator [Spirochaetota bacterium]|nr:ArsR family transcriptional regulator [Spirochaetota bacterium]